MVKKVTPGVNPKLVIGHYSEEVKIYWWINV